MDPEATGAKENKTERVQLLMTPSEVEAIDDWGFANRIRTRAEAIRRLCQVGLTAYGSQEYINTLPKDTLRISKNLIKTKFGKIVASESERADFYVSTLALLVEVFHIHSIIQSLNIATVNTDTSKAVDLIRLLVLETKSLANEDGITFDGLEKYIESLSDED